MFGSFATGRMGHDSDLDGMIDVPAAGRRAAWDLLEGLSAEHGLRPGPSYGSFQPERAAPSIAAARRLADGPCLRAFRDRIDPAWAAG